MSIAALFVPDFPVEAIVRADASSRKNAVAVMEGTPPLLHIVACNQLARDAGVEIGMTRIEAEARLQSSVASCQSLAISADKLTTGDGQLATALFRRSAAQEAAARAALLDCAHAFSPRVEDDQATPDTVMLDLGGLERLFGSPAKIAHELARRASELGLKVNVAVAGNPHAALHAARGFTGVTVIAPGEEAVQLGPLPIEVLLGGEEHLACACTLEAKRARETLDTLARWGVRTFRALAALPETTLRQRLGEAGIRLQKLARGDGSRPLVPATPPLHFEETAELEHPLTLLEPLSLLLSHMLEQLCTRLSVRALAVQEIRLELEFEKSDQRYNAAHFGFGILDLGCETHGNDGLQVNPKSETPNLKYLHVLRLPVPMLDPKVFLKLFQLELQNRPPGAPVKKVSLTAEPALPRSTQGGLFLPVAPEPEELEVMLARVKAVISRRSSVVSSLTSGDWQLATGDCLRVGAAELLDSHKPDAIRMKPFVAVNQSSVASHQSPAGHILGSRLASRGSCDFADSRQPTANSPLATAVRRFRPPLKVNVEMREERPVRMAVAASPLPAANAHHLKTGDCVLWAAGPWHESGEWWTGQPWSREVWDVALKNEATLGVYRIFRDALRDEWFMEAMYD